MDRRDTDSVRELVIRTFRAYGASEAEMAGMQDTHLIRDGHYCGRSFRTATHMAMWMGTFVQFYDSQGEMLGAVSLAQEPRRKVAA